jgi:hypothetical protein
MSTHISYQMAQLRHHELLQEAARSRRAHAAVGPRQALRPRFARVLARVRAEYDAGWLAAPPHHPVRSAF